MCMSRCRVPFQQALSLVGNRGVYIESGYAFVPLARLVSTVVTRVSGRVGEAGTRCSPPHTLYSNLN